MENTKRTMLLTILSRLDNSAALVNVKATLIMSTDAILLGLILGNYSNFSQTITDYKSKFLGTFFVLVLIFMFISIFASLMVIRACLDSVDTKEKNGEKRLSVIFFGDISKRKQFEDYWTKLSNIKESEYDEDIARQVYVVSKILRKKYRYLNISSFFFGLNIVIILLVIFIFIN